MIRGFGDFSRAGKKLLTLRLATKRRMIMGGCALLTLGLGACHSPAPLIIDSSCVAFTPIIASRQDSLETLRQILSHNQSWQARCGGKK